VRYKYITGATFPQILYTPTIRRILCPCFWRPVRPRTMSPYFTVWSRGVYRFGASWLINYLRYAQTQKSCFPLFAVCVINVIITIWSLSYAPVRPLRRRTLLIVGVR